jgi:hypothetical protein
MILSKRTCINTCCAAGRGCVRVMAKEINDAAKEHVSHALKPQLHSDMAKQINDSVKKNMYKHMLCSRKRMHESSKTKTVQSGEKNKKIDFNQNCN